MAASVQYVSKTQRHNESFRVIRFDELLLDMWSGLIDILNLLNGI